MPLALPSPSIYRGLVLLLTALAAEAAPADGQIVLTDVTPQTGISFVHSDGSRGDYHIVETVASGLALLDYDQDGDQDIYFLNSRPATHSGNGTPNALFRNDGHGRFQEVTEAAGVGHTAHALGVAVADFDQDGHPDIYVTNAGPNTLYHNNGDGSFTDLTLAAGVADGEKVGAGPAFFDMDSDGDLDLYVSNYVQDDRSRELKLVHQGVRWYPGPWLFPPEADTLYRNQGDGTFHDVTRQAGLHKHVGSGMGAICGDFDEDGDQDVFVCNDTQRNFLFENIGGGQFRESALLAGLAYNADGKAEANMGVDAGDFDRDGLLDLVTTNYQGESTVLYKNLGSGMWEDYTRRTGAGAGSLPHVTWGIGWADFDCDADSDLYVACGHVQDQVQRIDGSTAYEVPDVVLRNDGARFVNVSDSCWSGPAPVRSSRGAAFDDLDGDGDVDAVVLNARAAPSLLRNDSPVQHHWVQIRLVGRRANRDGVGARIRVVTGDVRQTAAVHSGRGYQSHFGSAPHFGLGKAQRIERIEVRWPGGREQVWHDMPVDQRLTLHETLQDQGHAEPEQ